MLSDSSSSESSMSSTWFCGSGGLGCADNSGGGGGKGGCSTSFGGWVGKGGWRPSLVFPENKVLT